MTGHKQRGKYSGILKTGKLANLYEQALSDREKWRVDDALDLLETRTRDLLGRIEENDAPAFRARALELFEHVHAAITLGDTAEIKRYMGELESWLRRGVAYDRHWDRLVDVLERRSRRVEIAHENERKAATAVPGKEFGALTFLVLEALRGELSRRVPREVVVCEVCGGGAKLDPDQLFEGVLVAVDNKLLESGREPLPRPGEEQDPP